MERPNSLLSVSSTSTIGRNNNGGLSHIAATSTTSLVSMSSRTRVYSSPSEYTPLSMRHYKDFLTLLLEDDHLTLIEISNALIEKSDAEILSELFATVAESKGIAGVILEKIILKYNTFDIRSPIALFEDGTFYSKMFTSVFKLVCKPYLWSTFNSCLEKLQKFEGNFEIDPSRMKLGQDVSAHINNICTYSEPFITKLVNSINDCPYSVRKLCNYLYNVTLSKFNNDKRAGQAAVIKCFFGHLICPTIIMPTVYGLTEIFPKKTPYRGLIIIAKLIQALSEGYYFDESEFMAVLNPFLRQHYESMQFFIEKLCSPTPEELAESMAKFGTACTFIPDSQVLSCTGSLHMFYYKNNTKITEYLVANDPSRTDTKLKINTFNTLKIILTDLDVEMAKIVPLSMLQSSPEDPGASFRREMSNVSLYPTTSSPLSFSNGASGNISTSGAFLSSPPASAPYSTNSSPTSLAAFATSGINSQFSNRKEIILNNYIFNDESPRSPLTAVHDFLSRFQKLYVEHPWKQQNSTTGLFEFRSKTPSLTSSNLDLTQKLKSTQTNMNKSSSAPNVSKGKNSFGIAGLRSLDLQSTQFEKKSYSSSTFPKSDSGAKTSSKENPNIPTLVTPSAHPSAPNVSSNPAGSSSLTVPLTLERRHSSTSSHGLFGSDTSPTTGPIDLQAISESIDFQELCLNLAELRAINVLTLATQQEQLCFWLNVHNLLTLHIHVIGGLPFTDGLRKKMLRVFKYDIDGMLFSLEDILQGILRGNPRNHFKKDDVRLAFVLSKYDPRAHFAISYLTLSTSPVMIYTPNELSAQLVLISRLFCQQSIDINPSKNKIILPSVFDTYFRDFGNYPTDIFRWIAQFLTFSQQSELALLLSSCKFDLTFYEPSWDPRMHILFVDTQSLKLVDMNSSYISTSLNVEAVKRYIHLFSPSAATASLPSAVSESPSGNKKLSFGRSDSITSTSSAVIPHVSENIALEIGVLNQDVIWTRQARKGTEVVTDLLTQLVELCNMFAYEWAAIAGSTEFKAFIYDCSELQKVWLASLTKEEKTAFWINTHNLLSLHLCVMHKPWVLMSKLSKRTVMTAYKYCIGGSDFSLRDIECGVLTNNFDKYFSKKGDDRVELAFEPDMRAHFGLTLYTRATPLLTLFSAATLLEDLNAHTRKFLAYIVKLESNKNRLDLPKWAKRIYKVFFKQQKSKIEFAAWIAEFMPPYFQTQFQSLISNASSSSKVKIDLNFESIDWTPVPAWLENLKAPPLEIPTDSTNSNTDATKNSNDTSHNNTNNNNNSTNDNNSNTNNTTNNTSNASNDTSVNGVNGVSGNTTAETPITSALSASYEKIFDHEAAI